MDEQTKAQYVLYLAAIAQAADQSARIVDQLGGSLTAYQLQHKFNAALGTTKTRGEMTAYCERMLREETP